MFESKASALVNTVNCVGVMGKGVAAEFKKRFPQMYEDYRDRCDRGLVQLGQPYVYRDLAGVIVVNFPTKGHWRSASRLSDIERGLDYLVNHLEEWGISSLAMPPLGCGNGGLDWAEVGPMIFRKLNSLSVDVEVYAPYGTAKTKLTQEYLSAPSQMSLDGKGRKPEKLNPSWVVLVEVLRELQQQPYATPVGRTIFQKICYVVTEMGVPTNFSFGKGSYGPFSDGVKDALHDFANRNWIHEEQLGRMLALRVDESYEKDRTKYLDQISEHQRRIMKAVDLFSRIKNTEQAEEVMTVLYACRQIKDGAVDREVEELDLYKYILDWKKSWNTDEKRASLAGAIRSLVLLGWMKVRISESMVHDDLEAA
uniref:type II toxin-antitoxin system antitoxin DNA ADP-ribosyl glycohydrolase DarG n=1 Tax=Marilutibacter maris TaxID=1605891 RepID=UPI001CB9218F|nr:macro domain-containing protein [Lysobacter maris]